MPESIEQDAILCRRLSVGDEQAFTVLYQRHSPIVYRYARSLGGDPTLADEIVQEAFLVLIRRPASFDPQRGELTPWLLGVARRMLAKRRSLDARALPLDVEGPQGDPPAPDLDALEALTRQERMACLRHAIEGLPSEFREVITLCDLEEISYQQAAEILETPVGTVRSRLHRARGLLARKLTALLPGAAKSLEEKPR